ncbi:hypothetical protein BDV11DRAFT_188663 [Aspergillus similis]
MKATGHRACFSSQQPLTSPVRHNATGNKKYGLGDTLPLGRPQHPLGKPKSFMYKQHKTKMIQEALKPSLGSALGSSTLSQSQWRRACNLKKIAVAWSICAHVLSIVCYLGSLSIRGLPRMAVQPANNWRRDVPYSVFLMEYTLRAN